MAINVSTLVPASEKAKNVATETYVDSAVAAVDVSGDIADNNDIFAQKLGYAAGTYNIGTFATAYEHMVAAAAASQTIINGGYINTGLIQANTILAEQINTTGLIADNINATDIIGKNIYGAYIEGARINGAIIKASYLDLDGELEVLTDYHIPVATYNASPSSYTDAIYIEADNEYRIPTISSISEEAKSSTLISGGSFVSKIRSYNCANASHNLKSRRILPTINISTSFTFLNLLYKNTRSTSSSYNETTITISFNLYIAGKLHTISFSLKAFNKSWKIYDLSLCTNYVYINGSQVLAIYGGNTGTYTFSANGVSIKITLKDGVVITPPEDSEYTRVTAQPSITFEFLAGTYSTVQNFSNTSLSLITINSISITADNTYYSTLINSLNYSSAISINNMI